MCILNDAELSIIVRKKDFFSLYDFFFLGRSESALPLLLCCHYIPTPASSFLDSNVAVLSMLEEFSFPKGFCVTKGSLDVRQWGSFQKWLSIVV